MHYYFHLKTLTCYLLKVDTKYQLTDLHGPSLSLQNLCQILNARFETLRPKFQQTSIKILSPKHMWA